MACGAGTITKAPGSSAEVEDTTTLPAATHTPSIVVVRLAITTNYPVADQYFVVDRIEDPDTWDQPIPTLVNGGYEFWVDIPAGARYIIRLREVTGAAFTLPEPQEIDLRAPSVAALKAKLEYGNLGEHGQI